MMNKSDVMDAGEATGDNDTLDINFSAVLGGINVDLSATGDQVTTINGMGEATVQKNFESVDLAGYTGFGAQITGSAEANTITGTGSIDQVDGGAGNDVIRGGAGADALTGGSGSDTFVFEATSAGNGIDTISDFVAGTGGDVLNFNDFLGASAAVINGTSSGVYVVPTASALSTHGTPITGTKGGVYIIKDAIADVDTAAEIVTLLTTGQAHDAVDFAASKTSILLYGANDGTQMIAWAVTNDATAAITAGELTQIGLFTTSADAIDSLVAANFVLV